MASGLAIAQSPENQNVVRQVMQASVLQQDNKRDARKKIDLEDIQDHLNGYSREIKKLEQEKMELEKQQVKLQEKARNDHRKEKNYCRKEEIRKKYQWENAQYSRKITLLELEIKELKDPKSRISPIKN